MMRIGITGHRELPVETSNLIDRALRAELEPFASNGLVGISAIADGADSLFAQAVLDLGGSLTVILPATQYREGFPAEHWPTYDALLAQADEVIQLDYTESNSEAHMAASHRMLDDTDHLIAVWDGQPARGYGGTADVVAAAAERGVQVTRIWPAGARRD
jgi:uncharacterized phage-like protein YoqJ